jgi:hypothetical protein
VRADEGLSEKRKYGTMATKLIQYLAKASRVRAEVKDGK